MKTEDEANETQCPYLTIAAILFKANAPDNDMAPVDCIASSCMMWEWGGFQMADGGHSTGKQPASLAAAGLLTPPDLGIGDCGFKRRTP